MCDGGRAASSWGRGRGGKGKERAGGRPSGTPRLRRRFLPHPRARSEGGGRRRAGGRARRGGSMTRPVGTATWVRGSGGGGGAPMSWMGSEGLAGGGRGAPVFRAVWAAGRDWPGLRRSRSPRRPPFRAPQRRRGGGAETALYKVRKPARGGGSGGADLVPPRPRGRGGGARARAAAYKRAAPALPPGRAARAATLRLPLCGVSPGLLVRLIHARLCSALPRVGRARAPERPPPCSSPAPLSPSALV